MNKHGNETASATFAKKPCDNRAWSDEPIRQAHEIGFSKSIVGVKKRKLQTLLYIGVERQISKQLPGTFP
jgi:hypothetical protein